MMKFRTEIGPLKGGFKISHDDSIVLLGSCFADNVGQQLQHDGFNVVYNPLGPLFNPASIFSVLKRGRKRIFARRIYKFQRCMACSKFCKPLSGHRSCALG